MNTDTAVTKQSQTSPQTRQEQQGRSPQDEAALLPPVDVFEDPSGITLYADLPGVTKDKLDLHVETDTLTIEAALQLDLPEGMEANHVEVGVGRFRRAFTLSKDLDASKISAELNQGVLTLRIPKAEHAQPRRIEVKVS
jgi:HSP20 family protein